MPLHSGGKNPGTQWIGGYMGTWSGHVGKEKKYLPLPEIELHPAHSLETILTELSQLLCIICS